MMYGAQYPCQPPQMPVQPMQQAGMVVWVVGRAGADAYVTQPGTTVLLMDSTANVFYLKETDQSGRASIRTFDFTERAQEQAGYATLADLAAMKAEILEAIDGQRSVPRHAAAVPDGAAA